MRSTIDKVIGSDEGIKLVLSGGKVLGTIIVNVDGFIPGIDVEIEIGSLYVSFDGLIMASLRYYCFDTNWDLIMVAPWHYTCKFIWYKKWA